MNACVGTYHREQADALVIEVAADTECNGDAETAIAMTLIQGVYYKIGSDKVGARIFAKNHVQKGASSSSTRQSIM